jgi:quercetin dioxygenase-like cupin family protein
MSIAHAKPNEVISLPLGTDIENSRTTTLAKTDDLELIRLVLPAGKEIPTHQSQGKLTLQCIEGRIKFTAESKTQELRPGQLVYLVGGEPHSLKAIEDSSLLLTLLLPPSKSKSAIFDVVQEAGEESFPASDSPAF